MVEKKSGFFYGYVVVALACLVLVVIQGTFFSFGVFFKPLAESFGWTRAMTAGALGLLIYGVYMGRQDPDPKAPPA